MSKSNVTVNGGVGFPTILFLVFLVLKLTKTIAWSWLWVAAPLWIPLVLACGGFLVIAGLMLVLGKSFRR